jgi:outer membrane protein OmpA-like peptidoglycan-associated protein/tetratricopeptide (TPR) repeat protein
MRSAISIFAIVAFLISGNVLAQRVSTKSFLVDINAECLGTEDSKALKQLEIARDRKKNDKAKRMDALKKAVEIDPDCAEAHYYYGLELLRTAMSKPGISFKPAISHLQSCVDICPDFHWEPYFFLASFARDNSSYEEAAAHYEKYFDLTASSQEPLDEDREAQIQLDYAFVKFFADAYANPVPFDPVQVEGVTTDEDEFLPLIAPDNQSMLVTRRIEQQSEVKSSYGNDERYTEKFIQAKRVNGGFERGASLPSPFNKNPLYHYGGASLSLDNKHIFITICIPSKGGYNNCDIYKADLSYKTDKETGLLGYHWSPLENMGPNVNTEDGWESQPSISADGKTLYFCSARADSKGIDIYYSEKDEYGTWGKAKNIGPPINTPYNDKTPYMHSDSRTLYFAADGSEYQDGHLGFGGYDVFYTRQNDDGTWSEPTNIGYPINTEGDEQAFVVSTDGKWVYYSSKHPTLSQSIDIWSFELYKEARPDKVVFVSGKLNDANGDPAQNATIELKSMKSQQITKVEVDANDGGYAAVIAVRDEEDVVLNVKADGMAFQSKLIETVEHDTPKTSRTGDSEANVNTFQEIELTVEEVKEGGVYRINDIYYKTNSAEISQRSTSILNEFALYLNENKSIKIAIHGHTDNVGRADANLSLSTDRAFSVKQFLESKGVSGSRIEYRGFGETVPFTTNDTKEGRAMNRRTEFLITGT